MLYEVITILLFTDGLHLPRQNPQEEQDWQTFVELYRSGGLQAVRDRVRQLHRITSYNVCYTKLLRSMPVDRKLSPWWLPICSLRQLFRCCTYLV